jgi:TonB family protein
VDEEEREREREARRLSWLVSILVHAAVILIVVSLKIAAPSLKPTPDESPRIIERVRLVPPDLGPFLPRPRPATPAPPATPARPTPPPGRDRISIGPESDRRQEKLLLEKDVEIGKDRIGPGTRGTPGVPSPAPRVQDPGTKEPLATETVDGVDAPRVPPRELPLPRTADGRLPAPPTGPPSDLTGLRRSLRNLDQRIGSGEAGLEKGSGQRMGPLMFDSQGADFTQWVNQFSREVYRNWLIPQPALLGLRGHVDIEFTVKRDGAVVDLRIVKPSGVPAFDRAAANALLASRLLSLPPDFRPDSVTMQASFYYNEDRPRS